MEFHLSEALEVLERTPLILDSFLTGLSNDWLQGREGEGTWSPSEVLNHLIEAEKTNWIPRLEWILLEGDSKPFPAFDRFANLMDHGERTIEERLLEFRTLRRQNILHLKNRLVDPAQFEQTGSHPAFGVVKIRELLSAWVVHDFTHMAQITRVMAYQYRDAVGPWIEYLSILKIRSS